MEILIASFKLPLIKDFSTIAMLCKVGYMKTNRKFCVQFNGSNGYISNVEICSELQRTNDCAIFLEQLEKKSGGYKNVDVNVFFSEENGVRVSIGKDQPRQTQPTEQRNQANA
ncbi:hypothetical protein [Runella limosa]|uniref:hypothetical protein n=1 Tax=Runella limosa TaxID=370978 RepID=UPI000491C62C|nr:hypothetical protein [Runella limosa]